MANQSLVAAITELIPEITLEAQYIYQNAALGRQLVHVEDVDGIEGVTVEFPAFTAVTGSASPAEGTEPTAHTLDLTMPTATIAKRSVFIQLSGLAIKGAGSRITGQIGRAMAMAKAKQDDAQIFGIVTATTNWGTQAGQTNGALTITNALAGLLLIQTNEVYEPINCVVDANGYDGIRLGLTPVANDDGISNPTANEVIANGMASRAFGMNWYVTERISSGTVTATASVTNGLIFVQSGIGYAHAWSPASTGVEMERLASTDTWNLIMNYYDSAIVANTKGVVKLYYT